MQQKYHLVSFLSDDTIILMQEIKVFSWYCVPSKQKLSISSNGIPTQVTHSFEVTSFSGQDQMQRKHRCTKMSRRNTGNGYGGIQEGLDSWNVLTNFEYYSEKLTWQWKNNYLKTYSLLKMLIFHCHVSFLGGTLQFVNCRESTSKENRQKKTASNNVITLVGASEKCQWLFVKDLVQKYLIILI